MIPIIAGLMLFVVVKRRNNKPAHEQAVLSAPKPKLVPIPKTLHHPPVKPTPKRRRPQQPVNLRSPQPSVAKTSPAFILNGNYELAKLFLTKYLHLPHVVRTQVDTDICTYQKRYPTENGERLWQVCEIKTPYGRVYLSLMLLDDGSIPLDTPGILISYDQLQANDMLRITDQFQFKRFGYVVFTHQNVINSENLLRFFIGDELHRHPLTKYFEPAPLY